MPFGSRATARYDIAAQDKTAAAFRSVKNNLNSAQRSFRHFSSVVGGLVGVGGLGALATQAINSADNIQKLGVRLGASTEFLSRMDLVAEKSGTTLRQVADAMLRLQRRASRAQAGTNEYTKAFEKLGIQVDSFLGLSVEDQFLSIAAAMEQVERQGDRTELAMTVMGDSGAIMNQVLTQGTEEIQAMWKEADRLGLTLSQVAADDAAALSDEITEMQKSMEGLTRTILSSIAPALKEAFDWMQLVIREPAAILNEYVINAFVSVRDNLAALFNDITRFWAWILELVGRVTDRFGDESLVDRGSWTRSPGTPLEGSRAGAGLSSAEDAPEGSRAGGGMIPADGLYELHAGERVVSNTQTFGDIHIHTQGSLGMSPSQTRAWVRNVLMPEIHAAAR